MVVLGATIKAKAGKEQELIAKFHELSAAVQHEDGCKMYLFNQDKRNPGTFLVFEHYVDKDAMKAHATADHFTSIWSTMTDLMDGDPAITVYEQVAGFKK